MGRNRPVLIEAKGKRFREKLYRPTSFNEVGVEPKMLPRVNVIRTQIADYLLMSTHDNLNMELYNGGDYGHDLKAIALAYCSGQESPFVMDVGANLGAFAIPLAKELEPSGGVVFCYEPQRVVFYQLCGNIFLNRLDNCHAMHLALGSNDGIIEIPELDYTKSMNVGGYSLHEFINANFPYVSTKQTSHPVQIMQLDNIRVPKSPTMMKIDVEGFEFELIQGGKEFLRRNNYPFLMLECWQADWYAARRKMVLEALEVLGYEIFVFKEDLLAQHVTNKRFAFEAAEGGGVNMRRLTN